MDKKEVTGYWVKFFRDAGIPTKTGASYAHVFVENRMHKDMLSELSADYLRLMGISVMGDVIAILRHAKSVHQESLRKVVILQSKSKSSSESSSSSCSSSSSSNESSSDEDVKMVEITKPVVKKTLASKLVKPDRIAIVKKEPLPTTKAVQNKNSKTAQMKSQVINKLPSTSTTTADEKKSKPTSTLKRKIEDNDKDVEMADASPTKEITPSSASTERSILKITHTSTKKIRPSSENDIMGPKLPPPKKTVFDRLGTETDLLEVSSTTMEVPKPEIETKFTRIINNVSLSTTLARVPSSLDPSLKVGSVFERLGGLKENPSLIKPSASSLKYIGVLKTPTTVANNPIKLKRLGTMRADQPEVQLKLRSATTPVLPKAVLTAASKRAVTTGRNIILNSVGLRTDSSPRLKLPKKESEGIFGGVIAANPGKLNTSLSVKARLGLSTSSSNRVTKRPSPIRLTGKKLARIIGEGSRMRMDEKKVSFGTIEQKVISPRPSIVRSGLNGRNNKPSVHSRLGSLNSF